MSIAEYTLSRRNAAPYGWARSVGIVETRRLRLDLGEGGFVCECGEAVPEIEVAYETYGELSPSGDNAVLVCPPLTAGAHVAGWHGTREAPTDLGWWDAMIGPGKAIDTTRWFVVCPSPFGGCSGTTGPTSIHPRTGKAWGYNFPDITIGDIVEVQMLVLEALGVRELAAVVGGSMGGMQALEWSLRYPDRVRNCICIAAAASLSAQALAFDIVGRQAILNDANWREGDYDGAGGPADGLALARMIGHITYLSAEGMALKFGRRVQADNLPARFHTAFEVESYLHHQGAKFVKRFDANSYLFITQAMDGFDLAAKYGTTPFPESADPEAMRAVERQRLVEAFSRSSCRYLIVALSSDWLFPASESWEIAEALLRLEKPVSFCELKSPHGHDGFLIEIDKLDEVLSAFLSPDTRPRSARSFAADPGERQCFASEEDKRVIASMIRPGSRVLDLGCGDGELLDHLRTSRSCRGEGIDIDLDAVIATMRRNLAALQSDVDDDLREFHDATYDYVVLNQTLQAVGRPDLVIDEILRVGREAIVSFPNFGGWRPRLQLLLGGRVPKTTALPWEWYDSPNRHHLTLHDFHLFCASRGIDVLQTEIVCDSAFGRLLRAVGLHNLAADRAIFRLSRRSPAGRAAAPAHPDRPAGTAPANASDASDSRTGGAR